MKFVNFLKRRVTFDIFYFSLNVCNQTFHISHVRTSQKVDGAVMSNLQPIVFI